MSNKYFEFNTHEYWALVNASDTDHAIQVYQYFVAGDSIAEVREEGLPTEVPEEYAKNMFITYSNIKDFTSDQLEEEFYAIKNSPVLIDGSLT